ncbi:L-serine dehydratase, beta chain [compost metagenome]
MRFKDVFSIIGPAMVGPSSSHTAGAVRIGRSARQLLGAVPSRAEILFYGSFAATYQGHGTDTAIVGGLLDYATDDPRIPDSLQLAAQSGVTVSFAEGKGLYSHPNTAELWLTSEATGQSLTMTGTSIGGGSIEIVKVNGFTVRFSGVYPTLIISHSDVPGMIADMTQLFKSHGMNIGFMSVDRKSRSGEAVTVLELDAAVSPVLIKALKRISAVHDIRMVDLNVAGEV